VKLGSSRFAGRENAGKQTLVPKTGTAYILSYAGHRAKRACHFLGSAPGSKGSLERWYKLAKAAHWASTDEIQAAAPKAKVLNGERVRFEVAGGNYRLVVAFDFRRQIAFVKFIGSHAQYDTIDALTVSQF
jgi:mRNA interferase HigB